MKISRRIHVLDQGRSIAEGTADDVRGNPQVMAAPAPIRDEDLAPSGDAEYTRKRKGPLKGGIGGTGKGGLFGDPGDFKG